MDGNCTFSWAQAEKMRQTESIVARSSFCVISRPTVIIFDRIIIPKLPTSTVKSFSFRHGSAVLSYTRRPPAFNDLWFRSTVRGAICRPS